MVFCDVHLTLSAVSGARKVVFVRCASEILNLVAGMRMCIELTLRPDKRPCPLSAKGSFERTLSLGIPG